MKLDREQLADLMRASVEVKRTGSAARAGFGLGSQVGPFVRAVEIWVDIMTDLIEQQAEED